VGLKTEASLLKVTMSLSFVHRLVLKMFSYKHETGQSPETKEFKEPFGKDLLVIVILCGICDVLRWKCHFGFY